MTLSITEAEKDIKILMETCKTVARFSTATRAQVGAVLFHPASRNIVSFGYNGMPAGASNVCELNGKTRDEVIHAEVNCLRKVSWWRRRNTVLGVTHAPCVNCAQAILRANIKKVYYLEPYGDMRGVALLKASGVEVVRVLWR
jgi:dCMP deaminase